MVCLLTFFNVCNKATKFRNELKRKYDPDFKEGIFLLLLHFSPCMFVLKLKSKKKKGGQRDATQVLSNGFFPALFATMYLVECGYGERPIDFLNDYKCTWYTMAILGIFEFF
jgi:uncharacterized membrane protein